MAVNIVLGGIGSGKTRYCIDEIRKVHDVQPLRRCVVLVPSHFSHETEKLIIDTFGGTGLNNIEVTSFEKLARELLTGTERRLAAPGKQAVISRAIQLTINELKERRGEFDGSLLAAVEKRGFVDIAASLISELHRYVVTSAELRERAAEMDAGALKQKLEITALISDNYDRILSDADYIDSDEDLLRLATVAGNSFKDNTSLWIDKFDEFLPQQLAVLKSIIDSGADITITFTSNGENTYYGTVSTIKRISEYTNVKTVRLFGNMRHINTATDLKFLFSGWFDRSVFSGRVQNAEIFEARDAYTEIEHTACRILDLVREDKYRFRDIAVICGHQESYSHVIEAIFDEYGIPYYSDERFSISEHPIAMQLLSLFDIIENNWDYLSMFEYIRAGFVYTKQDGKYRRISADDIDRLENYVLKRGIRGRSMWCREWSGAQRTLLDEALKNDEMPLDLSAIDELRRIITAPVSAYSDAVKAAVTVTDHCCALYEFLEDINLYQGLKAELLGMAMNRATADAQRFGQIWNLVLDVLDQINTALGPCEVTHDEFCAYMRAAMGQCSIRTIPSGVDRVFIGSVEKNRSGNTKVIFAIGAISGTFPADSQAEGFLSNADRETLAGLDIHLAPTTKLKTEKQYNSVYKTLSAVCERLCISYPVQTPEGQACRPAQMVIDICSKLPNIPRYNDIILTPQQEKIMFISSPAATMHKLLIRPNYNPLWKHVNEWFNEHDEWRSKLYTIRDTRQNYNSRKIELDERYAARLYDGLIYYSPTRLNTYSQCPFKSFMQYGLRARDRDEYELNEADTGSYAHELVRRFCEEIDKNYDWKTVTDDICAELVEKIAEETINNITESDFADKERAAEILRRMGNTVREVSKTVRKSICSGSFIPCAYEKKIQIRLTDKIGITGTIDRLDVCRHDGIDEYRVIDYKTGSKSFSVADICEGIDMQPVIYSLVIAEESARNGGSAVISGMYYSKMRNNLYHAKITEMPATVQGHLSDNTKLDGATFVETAPDGSISPEAAERIEHELARSEGSLFFGKKGVPAIGGNIRSRAAGGRLMDEVRGRIREIDKEIRSGNIEISPLRAGRGTVCDYCEYSAACRFDEEHKRERTVTAKDNEVWERLESEEDI